jgi:hypothetical protein
MLKKLLPIFLNLLIALFCLVLLLPIQISRRATPVQRSNQGL